DEVDFIVGGTDIRLIGRKAIAVNLSDLAAMAAIPHSVVVSVALPQSGGETLATGLYEGMVPLLQQFQVALAGGDTNSWRGKLVISVTAIGLVSEKGVLTRRGARPGDKILVTGQFGGSIFERQFLFTPRIHEALYLNRNFRIHAAMDVSDGLLRDLSRLARESRVGFTLYDDRIPIHPDVDRYEKTNTSDADSTGNEPCQDSHDVENRNEKHLQHALSDGEDFELILAVPPDEAKQLLEEQPLMREGWRIDRGARLGGNGSINKAGNGWADKNSALEIPEADEPVLITEIGEFCGESEGMARVHRNGVRESIRNFGGFVHRFG
ncbi:MAG: thiamine-monophosphate kinase, partial [Thermoguttaceae bacterium]|nr:thiamine-monophosphate kinase [Thermoguttaceae bacterium]